MHDADPPVTHRVRDRLARRAREERGQALILCVAAVGALIAMVGFAVDVAAAYHMQRRAQAAADASAMAAAQYLPNNTGTATDASRAVKAINLSTGTMTEQYLATYTGNDTVLATARASSGNVFVKVLGFSGFDVSASAKAIAGSYAGWAGNIAPWITDRTNVNWGTSIQFKTDQAGNGNFGGLILPLQESGCGPGTGGNDYRAAINNTEHSCLVEVGDVLDSKTGNLAGPTQHGLQERVVNGQHASSPFDPYSILQATSDGYALTTYNHANLVVIPVTDSIGNGRASFTVVGFAWFIITSYTNKTVNGMFIGSQAPSKAICPTASDPNAPCPFGAYNAYGLKVVKLAE